MQKLVPEAGAQELPSRNDNPSLGGSVVGKPKLPFGTRISYGIGHMAFGIKSNGFDYYLLAYYRYPSGGGRLARVGSERSLACSFERA